MECAAAQDSACREAEPPGGNEECLVTSPDTDGDGLPDCVCKSGLVLGLGDGIDRFYLGDPDDPLDDDNERRTRALQFGDQFGVSTDLSP